MPRLTEAVFSLLQAEIHLVWRDQQSVSNDIGIPVSPTTTLAGCPAELDGLSSPAASRPLPH